MRASSQSVYPSADEQGAGGNHPMGAQGVGALANSPYDIQHGGSPGGGGGGHGGRFVDDAQRDPETGMIQASCCPQCSTDRLLWAATRLT
jgi:hypothetical protein